MSLRALLRRALPRPLRMSLLEPRAALRHLGHEFRARTGGSAVCRLRDDWSLRCHPEALLTFRRLAGDPAFQDELAAFARRCHPGMVLYDLGANYGIFSLAAAHFSGGQARCVAVEPSSAACRILRENLRLAGCAHRVTVVEAAAGAEEGWLEVLSTGPHADHYVVRPESPRPDTRKVRQTTLPRIAAETGTTPTHLKVDVEGFEEAVVAAAGDLLAAVTPTLFLELHCDMLRSRGEQPEAVLDRLRACGYTRFELAGTPVTPAVAAAESVAHLVCLASA